MRKRRIVTKSSLRVRHNRTVVARRILSVILIIASVYFVIESLINALSNQIGTLAQDGYPVDDPVAKLIVIALVLVICGSIAYPHGQKLRRNNRYRKPATNESVVL